MEENSISSNDINTVSENDVPDKSQSSDTGTSNLEVVNTSDNSIDYTVSMQQVIDNQIKTIDTLNSGLLAICILLGLIFGAIVMKSFWIARVKE